MKTDDDGREMTMNKQLLIIILNYNDYRLTDTCVKGLRKNEIKSDVLIVDNGSENESYKKLCDRYLLDDTVTVIDSGKNGGYSFGNNAGLKYAERKNYKYYCIMNPDILIKDKKYFDKLTDILEKSEDIAAISGLQVYDGKFGRYFLNYWKLPDKRTGIYNHSFIDYFRKTSPGVLNVKNNIAYADVLSGCCFVIKANVFKEAGYFDENVFLFYEENILSCTLRKMGYREAVRIDTLFYHNHKKTDYNNYKSMLKSKKIQINSRIYFYENYVTKNLYLHFLSKIFSVIDYVISCLLITLMRIKKNAEKTF